MPLLNGSQTNNSILIRLTFSLYRHYTVLPILRTSPTSLLLSPSFNLGDLPDRLLSSNTSIYSGIAMDRMNRQSVEETEVPEVWRQVKEVHGGRGGL
ncbi:hypothetical protein RCIA17 [Methanocella arvoryzae MRE50]|uniref:Uncharacterized protein n=1 Tax=Methanocella arvoryzae (strain DSM 22066 / NBRC 105507 / MRE50) TaxID=351160 RepID=Q0W6Z2_METAR|nr:hypothetical protein RCIA17 [Methanocella arvoryzae MRE50]